MARTTGKTMTMSHHAIQIGQALLTHRRTVLAQKPLPPIGRLNLRDYVISYSDFVTAHKIPHSHRRIGGYLGEIARWSRRNGCGPLNPSYSPSWVTVSA